MGVFCQSPQACQTDFQQLLSSRWTDIGSSNQHGMSPPLTGTKFLQDHTSKKKGTQTNNFQLHSFGWWLVAISPLQRTRGVSLIAIPLSTAPWMLSSYNSFIGANIVPKVEPTERPTTQLGILVGGVNSNVWLPSLHHWSNSTPHCLAHAKLHGHGPCKENNCSTHHSNSSSKSWCIDTSEIWDTVVKWLPYATVSSHSIQYAAITKIATQHSNHIFKNIKHIQTII